MISTAIDRDHVPHPVPSLALWPLQLMCQLDAMLLCANCSVCIAGIALFLCDASKKGGFVGAGCRMVSGKTEVSSNIYCRTRNGLQAAAAVEHCRNESAPYCCSERSERSEATKSINRPRPVSAVPIRTASDSCPLPGGAACDTPHPRCIDDVPSTIPWRAR